MNINNQGIDISKIDKLKLLFEDAFQVQLELFLKNTGDYINELGEAIEKNDRMAALELVHKMKSSSSLYGADKLASLAEKIEYGDEIEFSKHAMEIFTQINATFAEYKNFISNL